MPEGITIGVIVFAALLDSINPCVFGVLIFLIAFMTRVFKSKNMMLIGGALYTLVVYVTYFLLGLLLVNTAEKFSSISLWIYFAIALIAIVAGLLEIKDYFWYGKGFSLQMIPGGAERIKYFTSKIEKMQNKHPAVLLVTTAVLGVFVVLVELPCTGAPYLAVLTLVQQGFYAQAVPLLLLYNFIFILPLIIIVAVAYFGTRSDKLEQWRKKHRGFMRLAVGLLLIGLGIYILYTSPLPF